MKIIKSFLSLFGEHNLDDTVKAELDEKDPEDIKRILEENEIKDIFDEIS